ADDELALLQRVIGRAQEGVAAALHRRGAGVIGLAVEDDTRAARADDGLHHADRDARLLEPRALLDVQLDVGGDAAGRRGGLGGAMRVEARAAHGLDEPVAVDGGHARDGRGVEAAAEGARAEEASVAALLVAQPRARLLVRRAPAHARHAAAGQRAEARECEQAIFQTRQRHGQHDPGVYRLDFAAGPSLE